MKKNNITANNVDDFIREKKKQGCKRIFWGKDESVHFVTFATAVYEMECYKLPKNFFGGFRFLGVKHYLKI